jgi:putative DNA primase/helicase
MTMGMTMQELKGRYLWICWNYVVREGKKTKVPCTVTGGACGTDEKYVSTWVTYAEAKAAAAEHGFSGIGIIIPKDMFFLDVDHKAVEDPFVQMLLKRFDSYAELSVSKEGVHILGTYDITKIPTRRDENGRIRLDRQFYMKNHNNGLELYLGGLTNRFAVVTEDMVQDMPLADCTEAVLATLESDMRRKTGAAKKTSPKDHNPKQGGDTKTEEVIQALRRQANGKKFTMLFDRGDISQYGEDDSAADCALCSLIAFRTGDDPLLIDAIFRRSALMRDKWEREDYRSLTISAALEACNGVFHKSVMPAPPFITFDPRGIPSVSVPLLARYCREHLQYLIVRDNATGGTFKYIYEDGCFSQYSNDMMLGVIKGFIAAYDEELVRMGPVNEVLQHLVTDLGTLTVADLNRHEHLINFTNGMLDISAEPGEPLYPHDPQYLSTIRIPCEWHGRATPTPIFDRYMDTLTGCDEGRKLLLLEFLGALISNVKGWRMKKALFLYGDGNTGKSVLKSLAERILGRGNFIGIDLTDIEARFGTSALYGKRLAGSSDMSFVTVSELKTFKKCTGGDSLFAEFKGMNAFEFVYDGLLWFCMNRLPKFGGDDGTWVYDRIICVPCENVIPLHKQDKLLLDKLYAEREGIVYQAVMAFRGVIANGYRFTEPPEVIEARKAYRHTNNTVLSFFEECMTTRPGGRINDMCTTGRVYKVYKAWCKDNNNGYAKTAREFRETLGAHLGATFAEMTVRYGKGGNFYKDLTLTDTAKDEYAMEYGHDDFEFLS